jgi:hypothetical protein
VTTTTTLDWNAIRVGDPITPMTIDVTATAVVAGAIATRDFMPVHRSRRHPARDPARPSVPLRRARRAAPRGTGHGDSALVRARAPPPNTPALRARCGGADPGVAGGVAVADRAREGDRRG